MNFRTSLALRKVATGGEAAERQHNSLIAAKGGPNVE
jgi:hypothetical protein